MSDEHSNEHMVNALLAHLHEHQPANDQITTAARWFLAGYQSGYAAGVVCTAAEINNVRMSESVR